MSLSPPSPVPSPAGRRAPWPLWVAVGVAVLALLLAVAAAGLYLSRRTLGRDLAVDWLRERGVEAQIDVEQLDIDGFTGSLRVGPAEDPEVVVDRLEVRYRVMGFWNGQPLGVEIGEVRLIRPVARAEWRAGRFSMGSLDRVIDELRRRPPRPDARQPVFRVEEGRFILTTDYGRADVRGAARIEDGKLIDLDAVLQPTALKVGDLAAAIGEGRVTLQTRGDRAAVTAHLGAQSLTLPQTTAEGVRINISGELPYPDLKARRGDGRVVLRAAASVDRLAAQAVSAQAALIDASFDGQAKGWIDSLTVGGALTTRASAGAIRADDLSLTKVALQGQGPLAYDAKEGVRTRLAASASGQGGWSGLGPTLRTDDATLRAVKRLVAGFNFDAPGLDITLDDTFALGLTRPARVTGAGGAVAIISPQPGARLLANGGGALRLALRGGGLPTVDAVASRYTLTEGGVRAEVSGSVAGSLGPLQNAALKTSGRLVVQGGAVSFSPAACTPVTLARLELGENDVEAIAGSLCPNGAPLLTLNDGAWRVRARAQNLSAAVPFLEVRVTEGAGALDLGGKGQGFQADMSVAAARVADTAAVPRFNPVNLTGTVASRATDWTGDLAIADLEGRPLGRGALRHAGATGLGGVTFDTGVLTFADGGLQPAALSPMAALIASPAVGRARFEGQIGWSPAPAPPTSSGVLTLEDAGFRSPIGVVSGLDGRVVFTSLTPLVTAPGQSLTAAQVDTVVPLTDVKASFQIEEKALRLGGGSLAVGGGTLRLDPATIPLDGSAWEGRLHVDGVQLSGLVEASPFADRVDLDAKVTGVLPFAVTRERVSVIDGKLAAIQPGRISIRREALTTVSAEGGAATVPDAPAATPAPEAPPTNTVTEFAYQAMEHLAFDNLDVTLNSLPAGRLGALFHFQGRFDPPRRQDLYVSFLDLITKRFLQRDLPLPSGTAVNLTLDSSLNLDEVLRDVAAARLPGSPPVQTQEPSIRP